MIAHDVLVLSNILPCGPFVAFLTLLPGLASRVLRSTSGKNSQ